MKPLVRPVASGFLLSGSAGRAVSILLVGILLSLAGCQPSTLISALEGVVSAAEIALPVIGAATGLPPQVLAAIVSYLQLVDAAAAQASTILAGPGTSAEKAAAILVAFSAISKGCNCIPPGTPQVVVSVIDAVGRAIGRFLANLENKPVAMGSTAAAPIKITRTDRAALAKIRSRAIENAAKLKDVKK